MEWTQTINRAISAAGDAIIRASNTAMRPKEKAMVLNLLVAVNNISPSINRVTTPFKEAVAELLDVVLSSQGLFLVKARDVNGSIWMYHWWVIAHLPFAENLIVADFSSHTPSQVGNPLRQVDRLAQADAPCQHALTNPTRPRSANPG